VIKRGHKGENDSILYFYLGSMGFVMRRGDVIPPPYTGHIVVSMTFVLE